MNSVAETVIKHFHKTIESYVSVEEIIDLMDKITSQMDYAEKITERRQSVMCTTQSVLALLPPYPLMFYRNDIAQMHKLKIYLERLVK